MTLGRIGHSKNHWLLFILPVLGIGFWFGLAFPFADRNESYIWVASLQGSSFAEILQNPIPSIRNFRPLAQALTWCLYHLSGENGILIQVINFVLLCAAIWMIIPLLDEPKKAYSRLFFLLIGFIYFSAFYYVLNLHGIFYSPILLVVAFLLKAESDVLKDWKLWLAVCFILAFFHPLILVFYIAYVFGWLIEKKRFDRDKIVLVSFLALVLLILINLLLPFPILSVINIQNVIGTARNVENHIITKLFTLGLCFLTIVNKSRHQKALLAAATFAYLALAIFYPLPFLLLLGFLLFLSLAMEGKWSLAGLVMTAMSFPLAVGSGAPTKASIFIFLLPYVLVRSLALPVINQGISKTIALVVLTGAIVCTVVVRMEINVPVLSKLISPVLVEKGKSYQLKRALMLAGAENAPRRIHFLQEKPGNIRDYGQPRERDNFPPTKQTELDVYQHYVLSEHMWNTIPSWYLVFGTPVHHDTLRLVHTLEEENCKPAYLYAARDPREARIP